jgi:hypothetical protein
MSASPTNIFLLQARFPARFVTAVFPSTTDASAVTQSVDLGTLHDLAVAECDTTDAELNRRGDDDDGDDDALDDSGVVQASYGNRRRYRSDYVALVERLAQSEDGVLATDRRRLIRELKSAVGAKKLSPLPVDGGDVVQSGYMARTAPCFWSARQVRAIEALMLTSTAVRTCVSTIKELVMRDGITFQRCNIGLRPSHDFQEFVDTDFRKFADQCIEAVLQIGVVPICYRYDPNNGQRIPYVPRLGTYAIRVQYVRGAPLYSFHWVERTAFYDCVPTTVPASSVNAFGCAGTSAVFGAGVNGSGANLMGGGIEDPSVEILHSFDYDVSDTGVLTSKFASVLDLVGESIRVRKTRAIADAHAADPTVATEYDATDEQNSSRVLARGAFVSTVTTIGTAEDAAVQSTYTRSEQECTEFAELIRLYEQARGRDVSDELAISRNHYCTDELGGRFVRQHGMTTLLGAPAPGSTQLHLPRNRRLVQLPQARGATDTIERLQHLNTEIYSTFGVPVSYAEGAPRKIGDELVSSRLAGTIGWMQRVIGDILTHVYNRLFLAEDVERIVEQIDARLRRNKRADESERDVLPHALLTESELYAAEAVRHVRVSFASSTTDNPEDLARLYALGSISQSEYSARLARRCGIDASQMCPPGNELPVEARRFFMSEYADFMRFKEQVRSTKANEAAATAAAASISASSSTSAAAAPTRDSGGGEESAKKRKTGSADKDEPKRTKT